ncbi:hypothetical protein Dimus_035495 [Dionaea muscipula]
MSVVLLFGIIQMKHPIEDAFIQHGEIIEDKQWHEAGQVYVEPASHVGIVSVMEERSFKQAQGSRELEPSSS